MIHNYNITNYDYLIEELLKIYNYDFKEITRRDINSLKKISYNLLKYNANITIFFYKLIIEICNQSHIIHKIKYKIIKLISNLQYKYTKSYNSVIYIESLLIQIYYLIMYESYEEKSLSQIYKDNDIMIK